MHKKHLETLLYSAGGVAALVVILIALNYLLGAFNARVDLTQGNVYTLSDGTKAILSKLEAPVKIRFYYSQSSSAVPVGLKTFAKRVEDLLREYERAGNGKVVIEKLNPEPDSDAEDMPRTRPPSTASKGSSPTRRRSSTWVSRWVSSTSARRCRCSRPTASNCSNTTSRAPSRASRRRRSP
jgi:hypothetical protein